MGHFSPLGGEGGRAEQALVLQVRLLDAHLDNKRQDKTNTMTNLQVATVPLLPISIRKKTIERGQTRKTNKQTKQINKQTIVNNI